MGDDFEEMARLSDAQRKSSLDARIARERRVQTRSRRIRFTCRYITLICGLGGGGLVLLGVALESEVLCGLSCLLFLPMMIAGTILFFMGGLASWRVRQHLTERERDLLDN